MWAQLRVHHYTRTKQTTIMKKICLSITKQISEKQSADNNGNEKQIRGKPVYMEKMLGKTHCPKKNLISEYAENYA